MNGKIEHQPFAGSSVITQDVKHFEVLGRLEFRAKEPKGKRVWSATLNLQTKIT